jgi:predicted phage terminase large subunit-like protein
LDFRRDPRWSKLPTCERQAIEAWATTFYDFQNDWVWDFGLSSLLVKSRRIGGSYSYCAAACLWSMFGETTNIVSIGEDEALQDLEYVEKHASVLAALGSQWARPAGKKYRNGNTAFFATGGRVTGLPSSSGRGRGGNLILDEFAYHHDALRVWNAAAPSTLHGAKLRIISTPDGATGLFHELAETQRGKNFRRFATTLADAQAQGFFVSEEDQRKIDLGDARLRDQFFFCRFLQRGGSLFRGVQYYTELPKTYRVAIGIDLAVSAKTSADWSVAVVMAESAGNYYIIDVRREQTEQFVPVLRMLHETWPGAMMHWYASASEIGHANTMRHEAKLPVLGVLAKAGKYTRALPVAGAWNGDAYRPARPRVLVPRQAPWLRDYVAEIGSFTGEEESGRHDDQVDATASAFDFLHATDAASLTTPRALPAKWASDAKPVGPVSNRIVW